MSTIPSNSTNSANAPAPPAASGSSATAMSQSDFLKLMVAQLQAQDPTNPVDNSQFASQMAQFSTLSATQDLGTQLTALSSSLTSASQTSQVLSSANLVGRNVLVPSTTATYNSTDPVSGAVNLSAAGPVTVTITDANGNAVRTLNLGSQPAGLAQFTWDGKDDNGNTVASGTYTLAATSGSSTPNTYVAGKVSGVGFGGDTVGTYLQVAGIGGIPLSQVAQIL
jgi:flagellar basal-body rod modification protein FlgD